MCSLWIVEAVPAVEVVAVLCVEGEQGPRHDVADDEEGGRL